MVKDPITVATVLTAYLYFVFRGGPVYMKNREPFKLRTLMLTYNAYQVVFNLMLTYMSFNAVFVNAEYQAGTNWLCVISNEQTALCDFLYTLNKYTDLVDTVLFVLRKKRSQITFLHVFHHVVMVAWPVATLHMLGHTDGEASQGGLINSVVHVIMYSYYFATIYGGGLKTFITGFMKKHVTQVQLVQFVMLLAVFARGTFGLCQYQWYFSAFGFTLCMVFMGLFLQMYVSLYLNKAKKVE